jgi:amidohydrolase
MSIASIQESHLMQAADFAVGVRHRLHQIPELAYQEFKTTELIRQTLRQLGIEPIDVPGVSTGTVAMIGDARLPCVALRADIDALPITEATGLPYASQHAGKMHACGHDGHAANLLAVGKVLQSMRDQLDVCVKLIFQPAEEGGGGANKLVQAGVLDGRNGEQFGPKVNAIFGVHGWPGLPVGTVSTKAGPLLAATDTFRAAFKGVGCHGAFPHLGADPIITAAEAVVNLQQFVSRQLDPTEPGVITVGKFHAGTATNVIPDLATIEGTIRTLTPEVRRLAREAVERRCQHVAAAGMCSVEVEFSDGYPPTINDAEAAEYVATIAKKVVGSARYLPAARAVMGGEDFAFYLEKVPGAFAFVGVKPEGRDSYPSLHSDQFDFTDAAFLPTIQLMTALATEFRSI